MKNFLAVDTGAKYMTVMAAREGQVFFSHFPDCAMRHSVLLMDEIDKVLRQAELSLSECDFFAAAVGPGSFTGIRIGISTVKGFCLAAGKPALPVTTFEQMAYNGLGDKKMLCLVDALHGHYYVCGMEGGKQILPPAYLDEEEILRLAETGFGLCSFEPLTIGGEKAMLLDPVEGLKNAVAELSKSGKFGELQALYIRKSQAEEQLKGQG